MDFDDDSVPGVKFLVVSPHYDDAPLSLGQSLRDGELSHHRITVGVVFGRSNWTRWFHPKRSRTLAVSAIRLAEETVNAVRFRYRVRLGQLEEAVLRTGDMNTEAFLDPAFDVSGDPSFEAIVDQLERWSDDVDQVISPLGIGDHIDHQLVAAAARRLADRGVAVAFYEDRPYAVLLDEEALAAAAAKVDPRLVRRPVSGPMNSEKHGRIWYPSQFDDFFLEAIALDQDNQRREHVWVLPDAPWPAAASGV